MRFSRDRRGQSVVIGAVVLFGFLIVALSLYQIQVVPQQSGQAEFEHFEDVQNDLVELRTAISAAGQSERPQFVDVKLGTSYQTRVFAINPPDPAGTLRTSDAYNITITDDSDTTVNVSTRFIEYRPRYNEIESGSTWYDNSVLYLEETDSNRPAVIVEGQNILVDNDTLRLTAVQNEFSASGTRKVAVELYPTTDATDLSSLNGTLDIRIPTRLGSGDGYWNESIENGSITYQGMNDSAYPSSSEVSALLLQADSPDNVTVNSVGIQSEPPEGATKANIGPAESRNSEDETTPPSTDPTFESVEAIVTSEKTNGANQGIEDIEFNWQLSESTEIRLRILDDGGVQVGSTTINSASVNDSTVVSVTSGDSSSGKQEPRPVTVEATIVSTGETCSATIGSGTGDGPFELSCT